MTLPGIHATFSQHRANAPVGAAVEASPSEAGRGLRLMLCVALLFAPGMIVGCGSSEEVATAPESEAADVASGDATAAGEAELAAPADSVDADRSDVSMEPDVADVPKPGRDLVGPDLGGESTANATSGQGDGTADQGAEGGESNSKPSGGAANSDDPGAMLSAAEPDAKQAKDDILPFNPYAEKSEFELRAEQAFADPADARLLVEDKRIWVDAKKKRVVVDGYVAISEGPLEMFACPVGTKEHESVVAVLADAQHVHTGLLAVGAVQGTPVEFVPQYRPATGQRIAIWVLWNDAEGKPQRKRAQEWVQQTGTDKQLEQDWVFAGSGFWTDPESGRKFYEADSGDLVCVSNFSTATLDLPVESSQSNAALVYSAFQGRVPEIGTPIRLVFMPIPVPGEALADGQADPAAAPEETLLTPGKPSDGTAGSSE